MTGSDYLLAALLLIAVVAAVTGWLEARRAGRETQTAVSDRSTALAEQRQTAGDLQMARGQLDALGEAALDGLLLLDDSRRILWANAAAWELFRVERPALGQSFMAVAHDLELNQAVVDALSGHRPIIRQTAVDGRTLRIRALPLARSGGAAVALEDVTELQRLGRARRDLVANISHELRTPLASIDLAAQTLRTGLRDDPELRGRMLDQIQSYVQTLSQLSQEMMDLAQIESGQVMLKLLPAPVAPLVERAVQALQPQADLKHQSVALDAPPELVALVDEQQVIRVIGNLVHNAIKFAPDGGRIRVSVAPAGLEDVEVCIVDNGPGIPPGEQDRVFERFYKADRARSRGGTGLGLAIARHIVEGHGGRIWVESVPGQGAKFCFTLPRA